MIALLRKHSSVISILLLVVFLVLMWRFPTKGLILGMIFLLLSFIIASIAIFEKHSAGYHQGKLTRFALVRNVLLDAFGILLAIILAALLGGYIAEIVIRQISSDLMQLIAGIIIGLLVGIGVGVLIRQIWERFVKFPSV